MPPLLPSLRWKCPACEVQWTSPIAVACWACETPGVRVYGHLFIPNACTTTTNR